MWLRAVSLKIVFLIISFQTVNSQIRGGIQLSERYESSFLWLKENRRENILDLPNVVNFAKVPKDLNPNKMFSAVTIKGFVPSDAKRFTVELVDLWSNIGFHMFFDFLNGTTGFKSYEVQRKSLWDEGDYYEELAIKPEDEFEINISATEESFKIQINEKIYWYKYRSSHSLKNSKYLRIERDVMTTSIIWNGWEKVSFERPQTESALTHPLGETINYAKIPQGINLKENFHNVTIKGIVPSDADRFVVKMVDGAHETDIMLIYLAVVNGEHFFNTYDDNTGYGELFEPYYDLPIKRGEEFDIIISTTEDSFKVEINEKVYWFKYREPLENVKFMEIEGDVLTTSIQWNGLSD